MGTIRRDAITVVTGNHPQYPFCNDRIGSRVIDRTNDRSQIAWDIETTGFQWDDEITVSGFWFPDSTAVILLNTSTDSPESASTYEDTLEALHPDLSVTVHCCPDEQALLEQQQHLVFDRIDQNYTRLIAFNADSWQGGFDLPFLRTRCIHHNQPWMFSDLQFADLWDPIKKRMNTTHGTNGRTTDINSLVGSHHTLFHGDHTSIDSLPDAPETHPWYHTTLYDPFTESGSAVYCYNNGDYLPVLKHNLADVHRTWELGALVRQYVPSKDIPTKKL